MYVITPHGGEFGEGVEVRLPVPNVTLTPNQEFNISKAELVSEWVVLDRHGTGSGFPQRQGR